MQHFAPRARARQSQSDWCMLPVKESRHRRNWGPSMLNFVLVFERMKKSTHAASQFQSLSHSLYKSPWSFDRFSVSVLSPGLLQRRNLRHQQREKRELY